MCGRLKREIQQSVSRMAVACLPARWSAGTPQILMLSLKQLAWTMMIQRRRRMVADDQKMLGASVLASLAPEEVRIVRALSPEYEFRHDQMRAFLAALWLVDETPTLLALQKLAEWAVRSGLAAVTRRSYGALRRRC